VLRNVGERDSADLRAGLDRMRADAAARSIPPEELRGATITLSNFGMIGGAIKWTRLSRRTFAANAVRLQFHALAYNLGILRALATPEPIKNWSLTLKEKLTKISAKVVSHGRYVALQMAEVAIPRQMFQEILRLMAELRPQPPPAPA
jgi:Transposase DDE domain group 1/2-oxoacid dehydrogenases acyltransferase (catalytic domain)